MQKDISSRQTYVNTNIYFQWILWKFKYWWLNPKHIFVVSVSMVKLEDKLRYIISQQSFLCNEIPHLRRQVMSLLQLCIDLCVTRFITATYRFMSYWLTKRTGVDMYIREHWTLMRTIPPEEKCKRNCCKGTHCTLYISLGIYRSTKLVDGEYFMYRRHHL